MMECECSLLCEARDADAPRVRFFLRDRGGVQQEFECSETARSYPDMRRALSECL